MKALKGINTLQLLKAIAATKTGNPNIYASYMPSIIKRQIFEQLNWFIEVALEGVQSNHTLKLQLMVSFFLL